MREVILDHLVQGQSTDLKIEVMDEPGAGGACHRYDITGFDTKTNPSRSDDDGYEVSFSRTIILFQNGTISENGVNGISNEALLAIVKHRLEGFQSGNFPCDSNAVALNSVEDALGALKARTEDRIARLVEGKHEQ